MQHPSLAVQQGWERQVPPARLLMVPAAAALGLLLHVLLLVHSAAVRQQDSLQQQLCLLHPHSCRLAPPAH
jgi:hypothetical protein